MTIVIDTRNLSKDSFLGYWADLFALNTMAGPHRIIVIADDAADTQAFKNAAVTVIPAPQKIKDKLLPLVYSARIIKNLHPDIYISPAYNSALHTRHFLWIEDTTALSAKNKKALPKVSGIVVPAPGVQQHIATHYPAVSKKCFLAPVAAPPCFKPLAAVAQEQWRNQFTQDKMFFICSDFDMHAAALTPVLKAFSLFKQMQQSSWKLVVACRHADNQTDFEKIVRNYKYKNDVLLLHNTTTENIAGLTASAYALICISQKQTPALSILEALQCHTPAIAYTTDALQEIPEDVVIHLAPNAITQLSEKMMWLYKNEALRSQYQNRVAAFSQHRQYTLLFHTLLQDMTQVIR